MPKIGYHHVTLLDPLPGNPLPKMVFDPFKGPGATTSGVKKCSASEFRGKYPYDCGCCKQHDEPVDSTWELILEILASAGKNN